MNQMGGVFAEDMNFFKHSEPVAVDTTALTEAFLEMDGELSRVQDLVNDYRVYCPSPDWNRVINPDWTRVLAKVEEATNTYLSLTSGTAHPTQLTSQSQQARVDDIEATTAEIKRFSNFHSKVLSQGINEKARRQAEQEKVRQEALQAQQEAAERERRAQQELEEIATRVDRARELLPRIAPALAGLRREFSADCFKDLLNNERLATELLAGAPLSTEQIAKAETLIDAPGARLRMLREVAADPEGKASRIRHQLHDARLYCTQHHLVEQHSRALDNSERRINEIVAALDDAVHPDYWAYANGLDKVSDFIQAVVERMRASR